MVEFVAPSRYPSLKRFHGPATAAPADGECTSDAAEGTADKADVNSGMGRAEPLDAPDPDDRCGFTCLDMFEIGTRLFQLAFGTFPELSLEAGKESVTRVTLPFKRHATNLLAWPALRELLAQALLEDRRADVVLLNRD